MSLKRPYIFLTQLLTLGCLLSACAPAANNPNLPQPSATLSPSAPAPPSVSPSSGPSSRPASTPSPEPVPSSAETPLPLAPEDGILEPRATYKGTVYDDQQRPLRGALVVVRSLNSSIPYEVSAHTIDGEYLFYNAPGGIQVAITVSKPGYGSQTIQQVLKENYLHNVDDPLYNRFDFKLASDGLNRLSTDASPDQPKVIDGRILFSQDQIWQGLSLRFSEPMDRLSVQAALLLYLPTAPAGSTERLGYDSEDFTWTWNSDDTELALSFKIPPTEANNAQIKNFQVRFKSEIRDQQGFGRSQKSFFLNHDPAADEGQLVNFTYGPFPTAHN